MILETKRLKIISLDKNLMELYSNDDYSLELALQLNQINRNVNDHVKNVIQNKILPVLVENEMDNLFVTFWTIIDKKNNCMVGDLYFKGNPNSNGEIEIGYGTHESFTNQGFMTEAVGCVTNWVLSQKKIVAVLAQTSSENIASQKILSNNNFVHYETVENYLKWKISKQ